MGFRTGVRRPDPNLGHNDDPEPYPTDACALNACYRSCDGLADQCYRNCDLKFMNDCNAKHSSTSTNHVTPIGGVKKVR